MSDVIFLLALSLAFGASIASALRYLSLRLGTEDGSAFTAILIVMCVNVGVLLPLTAIYYYPDYGLTPLSVVWFIGAGAVGTVAGRIFMYTSISRIGASRTSPLVASWALVSAVLGVVFLDEVLTIQRGTGIIFVVLGVAVIARETGQAADKQITRTDALLGLALPLGAAVAFGAEPIFANFGFRQGTPAPVGLVVKILAGTLGFSLYLSWRNSLPTLRTLRASNTKWFLAAGVASTGSLLCYYIALSLAPVSIVVPIMASNSLFVVPMAFAFMPARLERVTWQLGVGATVVVAGIVLITASG